MSDETDDEMVERVRNTARGWSETEGHERGVTGTAVRAVLRVLDRERERADRAVRLHTAEEARTWALTTRLEAAERERDEAGIRAEATLHGATNMDWNAAMDRAELAERERDEAKCDWVALETEVREAWAELGETDPVGNDDPDVRRLADAIRVAVEYERDASAQHGEVEIAALRERVAELERERDEAQNNQSSIA